MKGDLATEVPAFDNTFAALAKLWPQFEDELDISEFSCRSGASRTTDPKKAMKRYPWPLMR